MDKTPKLTPQILAMYLGCRVQTFAFGDKNSFGVFTGIELDARQEQSFVAVICDGDVHQRIFRLYEVKPILRRLEDMTEEEAWEYSDAVGYRYNRAGHTDTIQHEAAGTAYLLSKSFDLFGLIDSGLAIDSKTLKQNG